jgi:hypothetical protein
MEFQVYILSFSFEIYYLYLVVEFLIHNTRAAHCQMIYHGHKGV